MAGAERNEVKEYLLGRLTGAEEEQVELRLLADSGFAEEYDTVVDEITDDYILGKFAGEELAQVKTYFFASPARQEKLRFALALKERKAELQEESEKDRRSKENKKAPWKFTSWSNLAIAASVLIIAGGGFLVWQAWSANAGVNQGLAALQSAYRNERPLEARISSLSYAPFLTTRGPATPKIDEDELRRAELTLLEALKKKPTPAVRHGLGKVYLAKQQFDDAINQFDEALKADNTDAQLYSDLGAAWLEKGKIDLVRARSNPDESLGGKAVMELAQSFENINKALRLSPDLPEALFNRALYHQYMKLWQPEEDDWREYLKRDSTSAWANEAKQRLKLLEEQKKKLSQSKEQSLDSFRQAFASHDDAQAWDIVSSSQNRSGNVVVEQLLDTYLSAEALGRKDEAEQSFLAVSYAANLAKARAGDLFFADLADFYARAGPEQQEVIRRARALIKSAHDGWGQATVEESLYAFSQARQLFEQSGDAYESIVAGYWYSFSYFRQNNPKQSLSILEPLIAQCENNHYYWVLARLFYLMAGVQYNLNELSKAIDFGNRAADLAERTGDKVGLVNALGSLMEFHRTLGNYPQSLSYVERGFGVVDAIAMDPVQGTRHYGLEAIAFASAGLFAASYDFQQIALQFALRSGLSAAISSNYSFLALNNWKLGNYEEALRHSQLAYDIAMAHSNDAADRNLMAYASLQMANAARLGGDYDTAIAKYNRSIELYSALDLPTHLYHAHKGRLLCYIAVKNDELAKVEIATAISLVEKYRTKIFEENTRDKLFDAEQTVYDTAIDFEYSRMNNIEQAFQYSENSRARSLLDLINMDTLLPTKDHEPDLVFQSFSQPLPLSEIRVRLPPQVQLVQYAMLEDKLLIWVVSSDGIQAFNSNITASELTRKVLAYANAVSRAPGADAESGKVAARELFDILIGPLAATLSDKRQICFVPDKALNFLPFAALMSPSGRYLIQDHVLEISPSASVFVLCSAIAARKDGRNAEKVLSVGNPTFDQDAYPLLQNLPAAAREATEVAKLYGAENPLIENDATKAVVKTEMGDSEVIHFALHSVLDERFPLRSKLLFTKTTAAASDSMSANDVYGMKLSRTRLVVLSSCQTGAERYYKGEGMINLARPFIAARVPLVVASLWPVESESSAEFMISFHRRRTQEKTATAAALAAAQREMIESPDQRFSQPYYWAPFTLVGGYAGF